MCIRDRVDDTAEIRVAQALHQCAGKAAEYADDARDQGLCAVENGLEHLQEFAVLQGGIHSVRRVADPAAQAAHRVDDLPNAGLDASQKRLEGFQAWGSKGAVSYTHLINADAVTASAVAAQALAQLQTDLPNVGGVMAFFNGGNDLGTFAAGIVPFGAAMKSYGDAVDVYKRQLGRSSTR